LHHETAPFLHCFIFFSYPFLRRSVSIFLL
jgi:hypothetical protein